MRGAAMSLTAAAASGLVAVLLSVSVVQGWPSWGVTYTSTQICAVKGSTVDISCTYTYPYEINWKTTIVQRKLWYAKGNHNDPVDLKTDPDYTGRVEYHFSQNDCTLTIKDLRASDSAVYSFRFITNQPGGSYTGSPGVTLSVTDLQVQVTNSKYHQDDSRAELKCQSSCLPGTPYVWLKNGKDILTETSSSLSLSLFTSTDSFSCAVGGHERFPSPSVYAPRLPSLSASPSAEVVEGSSVTLTCSSDANPAATYTWYKKNGRNPLSRDPQLVLRSIQPSDSGEYCCTAGNKLGKKRSGCKFINVTYAPRLPSVSASPSAEVVEGSSVTLTCSSDANPAATYTWYKKNGRNPLSRDPQLVLRSIQPSDSGEYCCTAGNKLGKKRSGCKFINVTYAPRLPSVSASPSAEVVEGSSVTLTCSSDANPAANYTWYKEDEESPKASGQMFTITDVRPEHSGGYSCEAQNTRGRHNSTLHLNVVPGAWKSTAAGVTAALLLAIIFLSVFLCMRKKRASKDSTEPDDGLDDRDQVKMEEEDHLQYASVHFSNSQADPLYANIRAVQPHRHMEEPEAPEYAAVKFTSTPRSQDAAEDPSALYSTVKKT